MITVVTAFVPIPGHPRSEADYHELGSRLTAINKNILAADGDLEHCWLNQYLLDNPSDFSWSVADNPQKNSLAYHIVQAQKTEWLEQATYVDPISDVFVWIDYGIFHVPGVTAAIVEDFLERVDSERAIAIPGCWERGTFKYDDNWPCWRFCGGVMVVPRKYVDRLNTAMKHEYVRWLEQTGNISWEVNTLARVEHLEPDLPFWWYKADHDSSIFKNYRATEDADGQKAQTGLRGIVGGHRRGQTRS
jgi:hypothetical protein